MITNEKPKDDNTGCIIILVILAVLAAIAIWTSQDAKKLGPSDDPYYDAPSNGGGGPKTDF